MQCTFPHPKGGGGGEEREKRRVGNFCSLVFCEGNFPVYCGNGWFILRCGFLLGAKYGLITGWHLGALLVICNVVPWELGLILLDGGGIFKWEKDWCMVEHSLKSICYPCWTLGIRPSRKNIFCNSLYSCMYLNSSFHLNVCMID